MMRSSRRNHWRLEASLLVACLLTMPGATFAQGTGSAPSAGDLESARQLFKEGREARQKGDLRRALDRFKAAHAYGQTPVTAIELGRTHIQLGELMEGREILLSVGGMKVQPDETEKSREARSEAAELAEQTKTRVPTISVTLTGIATDAAVQLTLDGAAVPVVRLTGIRKANPGNHVLVARTGAHEVTRKIDLEEGTTLELVLSLAADPGPASPSPAAAPPGARTSVVTFVGAGVGVAGIAVGTIAGVIALDKKSAVNRACEGTHCPPEAKADVDTGRRAATVSTIGFSVAAAGVITAAVGYFVLSKPTDPARVQVVPFVGPHAVGVDVVGTRF